MGCPEKKTDERRGSGSHSGRCDGEPGATAETKEAEEQKGNQEPQKHAETVVFEQEKISHTQEPDSDMRGNENHNRRFC